MLPVLLGGLNANRLEDGIRDDQAAPGLASTSRPLATRPYPEPLEVKKAQRVHNRLSFYFFTGSFYLACLPPPLTARPRLEYCAIKMSIVTGAQIYMHIFQTVRLPSRRGNLMVSL